jgi:hypothetical protein
LYVAAIPLLILSAQGLEYLYRLGKAGVKDIKLLYSPRGNKTNYLEAYHVVTALWVIGLVITTKEVYDVNKTFAFVDQGLNPKTFSVLRWLKSHDPSLYYVNIGGNVIYWEWMPAAYILEMPVINFQHNRHLISWDQQRSEGFPFIARAKYQISLPDQPPPENAQQLREFEGIFVWYIPDTLPYAFSAAPDQLQKYSQLSSAQVETLSVTLSGTNRIVVKGVPKDEGDTLVVLMSNYPGWGLLIDGKPAQITPYNGYLGAKMLPGEHTYDFYFLPVQYIVGASISTVTLAVMVVILLSSPLRSLIRNLRRARTPSAYPKSIV